jgi:hypothetical protein
MEKWQMASVTESAGGKEWLVVRYVEVVGSWKFLLPRAHYCADFSLLHIFFDTVSRIHAAIILQMLANIGKYSDPQIMKFCHYAIFCIFLLLLFFPFKYYHG